MSNVAQNNGKCKINKGDRLTMNVPFFQVPNSIFDDDNELTEHELLVYIYLCRCGNQGAQAFPSLPTIGMKTKTSRRTAARAVSGLIEKGYIVRHSRTGNSNIYEVVPQGHGVVPEWHGGVVPQGHPKKNPSFNKNNEEAGEPSAALSINNQKAKAVVKVYTDQLKNKGMVPVHNEQKMIKQFADSPLAAEPEKQVVGKMKSWFKTADPYTVGQGYPLGLFIKDYNSIEKPPRINTGECAECSGPLYEDEDHTCKHNVLCDKCDVVIEYWGEKRDAEILQEHQCDPETLKYRQSFEPVDPEGMRRRKLQEAEEKKWKDVRRIES